MRELSISEVEQVNGASIQIKDGVAVASAVVLASSMLYPAASAMVTAAVHSPITTTIVGGVVIVAGLVDPTLGLGVGITSTLVYVVSNANNLEVRSCH